MATEETLSGTLVVVTVYRTGRAHTATVEDCSWLPITKEGARVALLPMAKSATALALEKMKHDQEEAREAQA